LVDIYAGVKSPAPLLVRHISTQSLETLAIAAAQGALLDGLDLTDTNCYGYEAGLNAGYPITRCARHIVVHCHHTSCAQKQ
jgi:hypothetical protein